MKVRDFIDITNWSTFDICKENENGMSVRIIIFDLLETPLDSIDSKLLDSEIRVAQPVGKGRDEEEPFEYISLIIKNVE